MAKQTNLVDQIAWTLMRYSSGPYVGYMLMGLSKIEVGNHPDGRLVWRIPGSPIFNVVDSMDKSTTQTINAHYEPVEQ